MFYFAPRRNPDVIPKANRCNLEGDNVLFLHAEIVTQTLHFEEKFIFFAFSLENIWSIQKKVVILQTFSRERCLSARVRIGKSMEYL